MNSARLLVTAAIVAAVVLAHFFRYEIAPTGSGIAYRLDRWTGTVTMLQFGDEAEVRKALPIINDPTGPWNQFAPKGDN